MSTMHRLAKRLDRVYDRLRDKRAFEGARQPGTVADFGPLRGHKYALLVTFRRSGEPVPTPVWFGIGEDGRAYVRSLADEGKIKRLRNDPHVRMAPCSFRGRPLGPFAEGTGRVLEDDADWERAEAALQANYGVGRRLYEGAGDRFGVHALYLELTPAPPAS